MVRSTLWNSDTFRVVGLALWTLVVFGSTACGGGGSADSPPPTLTQLENNVFHFSCSLSSSCHKGASPAGALNLEGKVFAELMKASSEVPAKRIVVPGDPNSSYIMDKLLGRNLPMGVPGCGTPGKEDCWTAMPPTGMIEADRIDSVRRWIAAGAKDN